MERYIHKNNWKVDLFQEHTFISSAGNKSKGYKAECLLCNGEFTIRWQDVRSGKSKNCIGCSLIRRNTKHSSCDTRLYTIWSNMKSRCYNENNNHYRSYGAKDVTVCDEWLNSFIPFKQWAEANGYLDNLTIDKDVLCDKLNISPKIYSPETCQWITLEENMKYSNDNYPERSKIALLNMSISQRKISDNDIEKVRRMLSIDLEYKDIVKIVDIHFSAISRIKDGSFLTIKELRDQIEEIV